MPSRPAPRVSAQHGPHPAQARSPSRSAFPLQEVPAGRRQLQAARRGALGDLAELDSALADEDQAERDRKDRGAAGTGTAAGEAAGSSIAPAPPAVSPPAATALPTAPRPGAEPPVVLQQGAGSTMDERGFELSPVLPAWLVLGRRRRRSRSRGPAPPSTCPGVPGTDPFHDSGTLGSLGN